MKFGYFGWLFTGYQVGNGDRSVEDSILNVLKRRGIAEKVHSAARTDKGVSAVSSAIAIDTETRPAKVIGVLNSSLNGIFFHSYAEVPEDFKPRHCDYKIYRYLIPKEETGPFLRNALAGFRGQHDFRNFCRMDERNPVREIRSIKITKSGGFVMVDFKARSFLWNQIRTMMAYAVDHSFSETQEDPFNLDKRYSKVLEPESLVLLDIIYKGVEFEPALDFSKRRVLQSEIRKFMIRNQIVRSFSALL